jgi:hypothetical protein
MKGRKIAAAAGPATDSLNAASLSIVLKQWDLEGDIVA